MVIIRQQLCLPEQVLLHPSRDRGSRYRLYNEERLHNLRTVALLRKANYTFEAIRTVLMQLAQGNPEQSLAAAEQRLKELAETTYRRAKATAAWEYLGESSPGSKQQLSDFT